MYVLPSRPPSRWQKILGLINKWIQNEAGTKRFYAWINTFRGQFLELYKTLPQPKSDEQSVLSLMKFHVKK